MQEEAITQIRTHFRGEWMEPADARPEEAPKVYYAMISREPRPIARCADAADRMTAVQFVRQQEPRVSSRCGGNHVREVKVCDDGLVLDLAPIKYVPVSSGRTETRNRFIPSGLSTEIFRDVFARAASFLPGVTDVGALLLRACAIEVARVDQNGGGAISFTEADIERSSDGLPNTRFYLSPATFNRFIVTREINDRLLAPRLDSTQRAWVLSAPLTLVPPAVPASVPEDADLC